ncbi:MAG TPA: hypothetical protein VG847_03440 [Chitinophagaceae bacterium]|nr:hypothetical protein [Chitinophagaceae bacterium]
MSIDSPNAQLPLNAPNADNFNYIDTYVEFVAEVILKHENAIPETGNRPQKEWQMQKQFELVCQKIVPITIHFFASPSKKIYCHFTDSYAYQFIKEINPPPPKAC